MINLDKVLLDFNEKSIPFASGLDGAKEFFNVIKEHLENEQETINKQVLLEKANELLQGKQKEFTLKDSLDIAIKTYECTKQNELLDLVKIYVELNKTDVEFNTDQKQLLSKIISESKLPTLVKMLTLNELR